MKGWGLSPKGFNRPNQHDIKEEMDKQQRKFFGVNVNLNNKSPNGIINGILSYFFAKLYEEQEELWHAGHPSEAEGVQLDYLASFFGKRRARPQYAMGTFTFVGTPGYTVPYGRLFAKQDGTQYFLLRDVTLNENGIGEGMLNALSHGTKGNAAPNTVTVQVEPDSDITEVYNASPIIGGVDKESDDSLRSRMLDAPAAIGSGTINAIYADLYAVNGVTSVLVKNNNTASEVDGLPPHSNAVYVQGGDDQAIAEALMNNNVGLQFFGAQYYDVDDAGGHPHKIGFTRAKEKTIYIKAEIKASSDTTNLSDVIKNDLIALVGGVDNDGIAHRGLNMGEDVIYTKVISAIAGIDGVDDLFLSIGDSLENLSSNNVVVDDTEVAQTSTANIEVTFV